MPDLSANPLRVVCPTCGADRDEECRGFDVPGLAVAHVARYPDTPLRGPSDPTRDTGPDDTEPGFAATMNRMTRHEPAS